jgi:hypothetical protein
MFTALLGSKWIKGGLALLLFLAATFAIVKGFDAIRETIFQQGKKAGIDERDAQHNADLLRVQQELNDRETKRAEEINGRIDKAIALSQQAIVALNQYTAQGRTFNQSVLDSLKDKPLVDAQCRFTPEFIRAWDEISRGVKQ